MTNKTSTKPTTIDSYIAPFPPEVQERLQLIRRKVKELAPDATESISYGIPSFRLNSTYLVYFAGWKDFVSIYPLPDGDADFEAQIAPYKAAKGTARFPHRQPLPLPVIERLIRLSIEANTARAARWDSSGGYNVKTEEFSPLPRKTCPEPAEGEGPV